MCLPSFILLCLNSLANCSSSSRSTFSSAGKSSLGTFAGGKVGGINESCEVGKVNGCLRSGCCPRLGTLLEKLFDVGGVIDGGADAGGGAGCG